MDRDMWLVMALLFVPAFVWVSCGNVAGIVATIIIAVLWFFYSDFGS